MSRNRKKGMIGRIYVWLIYAFLYAPILVLIFFSFNQSKSRADFTGFSFKWYVQLFHNETIWASLSNTLIIALLSSLIATILGTVAAIGINGMKKRPRGLSMQLTYIPIINPEIVTGISMLLLFTFIGMKMGMLTVLIAHVTFCVPYVILNVLPKLRQMDPSMYEAAQDLGCNPRQAFFKVVLPDIMPGVLSGLLMSFTFSLDDFIITFFVNGTSFETLPITIYSMTRRRVSPEINALSTLIFVVVLALLLVSNIVDARKAKALGRKESI